jgi:Ner family transcriptional regulator
MATGDWTRGRIRYELEKAGVIELYHLDRSNNLPLGTCSNTIAEPHRRAEEIIAAAVKRKSRDIWPSRFDAHGNRLRPQPPENYRRARPAGHRQKERAA